MEIYLLSLGFIAANSYFMFKAGEKAGKFTGMISIVQFFKEKNVLKDKNNIQGFKNWPLAIQMLYTNPDPEIFEDWDNTHGKKKKRKKYLCNKGTWME